MKAVIGALVDMPLMWHLRLGQRDIEGRPSVGDARVLFAVLRIDWCLDLSGIGGARLRPIERDSGARSPQLSGLPGLRGIAAARMLVD